MKKMPIIHRKIVVTSTYCLIDRSIRFAKLDFVKDNLSLCRKVYDNLRHHFEKWWRHPESQKLEILIRVKFGYSPKTYSHDILWHFKFLYEEYLNQRPKKKFKKITS